MELAVIVLCRRPRRFANRSFLRSRLRHLFYMAELCSPSLPLVIFCSALLCLMAAVLSFLYSRLLFSCHNCNMETEPAQLYRFN